MLRTAQIMAFLLAAFLARADEHRLALVIGNDRYPSMPLHAARNNARAMRSALGDAGFSVSILEDADSVAMSRAVEDFADKLHPEDEALVYYSGRATTASGENYLLPTNFSVLQNYPALRIQEKLERSRAGLSIIVLDACYDTGGLVEMHAGPRTLIAFSAAAGKQQTEDPIGSLDVFTKNLVENLRGPSQDLREMFYRLQKQVSEDSSFKQFPFISDNTRKPKHVAAGLYSDGAYRGGAGIIGPKVLSQVNPEYSEEARKSKLHGTVVLKAVVDANGDVGNVQVVRGLGSGLDEKALEAVKQWKFKPGSKDDKPVAVMVHVEVNFRL